ncbi:hypothetical protein P4057_06225 [Pseudomonas aeruginosa]|nr:hypothetical protein [Pseudomonas aeruginosa]
MKLQLPSAVQLLLRYGASELTQIAVPDSERPIAPELLQAAAEGLRWTTGQRTRWPSPPSPWRASPTR